MRSDSRPCPYGVDPVAASTIDLPFPSHVTDSQARRNHHIPESQLDVVDASPSFSRSPSSDPAAIGSIASSRNSEQAFRERCMN